MASGKQDQKAKQKSQDEKMSASEKEEARRQQEDEQKRLAQQQKEEQQRQEQEKEQKGGKVDNDRAKDGSNPNDPRGALAERIREAQRWGILPPKIAEAMLYSSGKEAPQEYREIIARYYKRLTEVQAKDR